MADTYYLSKYALSNGGKITKFVTPDQVSEHGYVTPRDGWYFYKVGLHAHTTASAAIAAAEAARTKKITSLRKQIAKLEKLKFTMEESND